MDDPIETLYKPIISTGERIRQNFNDAYELMARNVNYGKIGAIGILALMLAASTIAIVPKLFTPNNSTALAVYEIARELLV